jgi:hypothetical protein
LRRHTRKKSEGAISVSGLNATGGLNSNDVNDNREEGSFKKPLTAERIKQLTLYSEYSTRRRATYSSNTDNNNNNNNNNNNSNVDFENQPNFRKYQ